MTENNKALIADSEIEWEDLGNGIKRKIMAYSEEMMVVKVAFEKGGIGDLHHHIHSQASYIASGMFEVCIDNVKKVLKAGDVFFVTPDLVHGVVCLEEGVLVDTFNPMRADFI